MPRDLIMSSEFSELYDLIDVERPFKLEAGTGSTFLT
jgi:hypothetical protein